MNVLGLKSDPERDLAVLADRIKERAEEYFGECVGHSPDESRPWLVEGTPVPLSALTCQLLNETVMHGYDIRPCRRTHMEDRAYPCGHGDVAIPRSGATNCRSSDICQRQEGGRSPGNLSVASAGEVNGSILLPRWVAQGRRALCPAGRLSYQPIRQRSSWCLGLSESVERDRQGSAHGLGSQALAGIEVQVPGAQPLPGRLIRDPEQGDARVEQVMVQLVQQGYHHGADRGLGQHRCRCSSRMVQALPGF